MGWFKSIANIGKKLIGKAPAIGRKLIGSQITGGIGKKIADKVTDKASEMLTGAATSLLDSDAGKSIAGTLKKGAGIADKVTGGSLGLKRKAEELESAVRSGKLAKQAAEFASRKAAQRLGVV